MKSHWSNWYEAISNTSSYEVLTASNGRTALDLVRTARPDLVALARHPGRVFTRAQLLERVWGDATRTWSQP